MATLKAASRRKLPSSAFAYPRSRSYPIHDKAHARAALSLAARKNTKGSYAHVAAAVRRKYGSTIGLGKKRTTKRRATSRRRRR
jgi:hypothetical protein